MKKTNITKKYLYILMALVVIIPAIVFVIATAPPNAPTHGTLYTDKIEPKTGSDIEIDANVGIGTMSPGEKLTVNGRISIATDPNSGDDVMDRDYADSRYINVGESGDSIADNTIDSSEIQDNTLTASDLAANSVGNSELIDNPSVSTLYATNVDVSGTALIGYEVVWKSNCPSSGSCQVYCPSGKKVLGGGCECGGNGVQDSMPRYPPNHETQWHCYCRGAQRVESAVAVCARVGD